MTRPIGFSTGALALGDFQRGLKMCRDLGVPAIEVSVLRDHELPQFLDALPQLDFDGFSYLSFHAPSQVRTLTEDAIVAGLRKLIDLGRPIIVHPDVIQNPGLWVEFGDLLCLENMDKRKPIGRSADELGPLFDRFPDATLCFDIGHARQVDPTMGEATTILRRFGHRIRQVHFSEVNSRSGHDPVSFTAVRAYRKVAALIPEETPIIIESVIRPDQARREIDLATQSLAVVGDALVPA